MRPSAQATRLNQFTLAEFQTLFATLAAPAVSAVAGRYTGELVGPRWLRRVARPGLFLGGLGGWAGKWFDGEGNGYNLVRRGADLQPAVPFVLRNRPSRLDGQIVLTLIYPPQSRVPWFWVVDEFRVLDRYTLLGMMVVKPAGLDRQGFPFLLHATREAAEFGGGG